MATESDQPPSPGKRNRHLFRVDTTFSLAVPEKMGHARCREALPGVAWRHLDVGQRFNPGIKGRLCGSSAGRRGAGICFGVSGILSECEVYTIAHGACVYLAEYQHGDKQTLGGDHLF